LEKLDPEKTMSSSNLNISLSLLFSSLLFSSLHFTSLSLSHYSFCCSQQYIPNTAILVTKMSDYVGNEIEVTDFCPRFPLQMRLYR
jgi:hypothetical protein